MILYDVTPKNYIKKECTFPELILKIGIHDSSLKKKRNWWYGLKQARYKIEKSEIQGICLKKKSIVNFHPRLGVVKMSKLIKLTEYTHIGIAYVANDENKKITGQTHIWLTTYMHIKIVFHNSSKHHPKKNLNAYKCKIKHNRNNLADYLHAHQNCFSWLIKTSSHKESWSSKCKRKHRFVDSNKAD